MRCEEGGGLDLVAGLVGEEKSEDDQGEEVEVKVEVEVEGWW